MWADLADNRCVGDFFTSVGRDVIVVDKKEGIRPLNTLSFSLHVTSYPLTEAAHIIGVGRGPGCCVLGVITEFAILHELARLFIEYWKSHDTGASCVCPDTVSNRRIQRLWDWQRRGEDGARALAFCYWVF